jgi:hypothetical protein
MTTALLFLLAGASPLEWKDLGDGRIALLDAGKQAFVYNYGPQLSNNAPEDRRRCCYIFPVATPAGIVPVDDFPKDHYHHHGVFWGWPAVETGGKRYDFWMYLAGAQFKFEKLLGRGVSSSEAWIKVQNAWHTPESRIVEEVVSIRAFPAKGNSREFEIELTLAAQDQPVTLRGSQERGKSYGGVSARFAPREGTTLRADGQPIVKDEDLVAHRAAELEASYGGKRAVLRIRALNDAPHQWCLRNYGFVGASFPGRFGENDGFTLEPGKPLKLRYMVTVADVP